jgi:hypothetical protein
VHALIAKLDAAEATALANAAKAAAEAKAKLEAMVPRKVVAVAKTVVNTIKAKVNFMLHTRCCSVSHFYRTCAPGSFFRLSDF